MPKLRQPKNLSSGTGLTVSLAILLLCWCGCERSTHKTETTSIPFQITEREGLAALQFAKWTLVFESIPARDVPLGATGNFGFSTSGGAGSETNLGKMHIRQFSSASGAIISVNAWTFKLSEGGNRTTFGDRSYEAKASPRTVVIGKDGKTSVTAGP